MNEYHRRQTKQTLHNKIMMYNDPLLSYHNIIYIKSLHRC
jgi:hypothetical protein